MRILVLLLFVGFLAATPAYLLNYHVMPELTALSKTYGGMEETARQAAAVPDPSR